MKLVVDANILFSFFEKDSFTRRFMLSHPELELFTPTYVFDELDKHKGEIESKSKINDRVFELTKTRLLAYVNPVPLGEFKKFWEEAKRVSPDPDDAEYFAVALKLGCPIWSNDGKLKDQPKVKVLSIAELLELLGP
jgi:predicted nucleic acid-binding protein